MYGAISYNSAYASLLDRIRDATQFFDMIQVMSVEEGARSDLAQAEAEIHSIAATKAREAVMAKYLAQSAASMRDSAARIRKVDDDAWAFESAAALLENMAERNEALLRVLGIKE